MNDRIDFYRKVVATWLPDPRASVLIVGAEDNDKEVFLAAGFGDVTLLNIDHERAPLPVGWEYLKGTGEHLPFPDSSFDVVVAHATLHHCRSPHAVLLEMYRVAKKKVVFVEARDSAFMRVVEWLGITQVYETSAVHFNDGVRGGVDDTAIPNFIYRWTERDVEKTVRTYAPQQNPEFRYLYGLALPQTPRAEKGRRGLRAIVSVAMPLARLILRIFPRQRNLFAACVCKPDPLGQLHPWLRRRGDGSITFDRAWGQRRFQTTIPGDDCISESNPSSRR